LIELAALALRWCDKPPSRVPPKIRASCSRLGIHPEKQLTIDAVINAWSWITRHQTEKIAESVNLAKDRLIRWIQWLEANPGADSDLDQPDEFSKVPRRPLPSAGSGAIALPLLGPEGEET
jgi:hypothetical protein